MKGGEKGGAIKEGAGFFPRISVVAAAEWEVGGHSQKRYQAALEELLHPGSARGRDPRVLEADAGYPAEQNKLKAKQNDYKANNDNCKSTQPTLWKNISILQKLAKIDR